MLKGFRTLIVNLMFAVVPAGAAYLGGVDWTAFLGDVGIPPAFAVPAAMILTSVVNAALRMITTTPPGRAA